MTTSQLITNVVCLVVAFALGFLVGFASGIDAVHKILKGKRR